MDGHASNTLHNIVSIDLWPFDLTVNACQGHAVQYTCTKFGVDSWSPFIILERIPTINITIPVHWLLPTWVIIFAYCHSSPLSPLLFVINMEAISREFRVALPQDLSYADDLVQLVETVDDLIKWLNEWKDNMENTSIESKYE